MLVLVLLAGAFASFEYDVADRLGWGEKDSDPAQVAPPEGVDIPRAPQARPVALPAATQAPQPARIKNALAPYVGDKDLGKRKAFAVGGIDGNPTWTGGRQKPITPASTLKILTTTAALASLGPDARFDTTVRLVGPAGKQRLVLVGGGDPLLSRKPAKGDDYPRTADLTTLARETAEALTEAGTTSVSLDFDDSLFAGNGVSPDWPANYITDYVVSPIRALWVDQGSTPGQWGLAPDPAAMASQFFAKQLRKQGITVTGRSSRVTLKPGQREGEPLARVQSPPVDQIVDHVLAVSDNEGAEVLAHQVAIAEGETADFAGGARAVRAVLDELGVPLKGVTLKDGSGLSRDNRLLASTLVHTLGTAASPKHPELRPVITGLPVAGFNGSLSGRFVTSDPDGRGRVRAKTGTLTGVHSLAGVTTDLDGKVLVFAFLTDKVKVEDTLDARNTLDDLSAALGACRC